MEGFKSDRLENKDSDSEGSNRQFSINFFLKQFFARFR